VPIGGKPPHVEPDLGDDDFGSQHVDAVDRVEQLHRFPKGAELGFDLDIDRVDGATQSIDLAEMKPQQKAMLRLDPAGQRLDQDGTRRLDAAGRGTGARAAPRA
jgi:hypothetical protein